MPNKSSTILDVEVSIHRALAGARRTNEKTLIYLLEMALEELRDIKGNVVDIPA